MKYVSVILTLIITSLFFFPIEFVYFLHGTNTKMLLAVLGLLIFLWNSISRRSMLVPKEIFITSIIAGIFSLVVLYSVTYNHTDDYTYTTYIISMWVWLVAAYAVCSVINRVHGYISVKLIANYLIAICILQCILALLIDNIPAMKLFVDSYLINPIAETEVLHKVNRLYGIGAALDVAGTRFASILVMIAVLLCNDHVIKTNTKYIVIYVFVFILIAVVGSMMARTTNTGLIVAIVYTVYASGLLKTQIKTMNLKLWGIAVGVTFCLVLICIYLYNTVPAARSLFRFGFENFFNWIETGIWQSQSTNILQRMWILPETLKTWIIGDGYFYNPFNKQIFYMGTDVGYLRFIYYCGLVGLFTFSMFFVYISAACYKRFPKEKHLFLLLLILVFVIWVKVSTDIFLVYALFLCIPMVQKQSINQMRGMLS